MAKRTKRIDGDDSLNKIGGRWKAALAHSDTGPLAIAKEVVDVSRNWSAYKDEANGMRCTAWLCATLGHGKGLGFFERRLRAVEKLGEACRRYMHHDLAVWLSGQTVDKDQLYKIKRELHAGFRENGDNALTLAQGRRVVYEILGRQQKSRMSEVVELRKRIRELEQTVVTLQMQLQEVQQENDRLRGAG